MTTQTESYRKRRLSKSDYLAGVQCPKQLWLRVNEPNADELESGDDQEALFEQGRRVGELARTYIPGGTLIDFPYYAVDEKLRATKRAFERGSNIVYEAAFAHEKQFIAIDILERTPSGLVVTEVKSSTKVKPEHLEEIALQAYVLQQNGLQISQLRVMHINRDCTYPSLESLFVIDDVTEVVSPLIEKVGERIQVQRALVSDSLPLVKIGPHCSTPYECPLKSRCWADVPPHHVTTLYATSANKAFDLVEQGFTTIRELPSDSRLSSIAKRQRRAVVEGRLIVEPTLGEALKDFSSSIGFLDFETVGFAIPVWNGCHPYEAVPVQFSFCSVQPDGTLVYSEWLADGPGDPREAIAAALIEACRHVERIAAYNAGFESKCIRHLANAVPHLAGELENIDSRLVDLLTVVRNHVYDPEFYGSFGLKRVFPVLTEDSTYETLEIADGSSASWMLQALLLEPNRFRAEDILPLRQELLAYCRTDTEALAKLLSALRKLAVESVALDDVANAVPSLCLV